MPRNSLATAKAHALDAALRGLFRTLGARPAPDLFAQIVEQLEAAARARGA